MPEIGDILDVAIEDLSPEQLQQLKDATDQFQQKCLMSFKKNRVAFHISKTKCPGFYCQERLTPQLCKRKKSACKRFGMLRKTCWVSITGLSWACSSK
jgi:hypothetical protein